MHYRQGCHRQCYLCLFSRKNKTKEKSMRRCILSPTKQTNMTSLQHIVLSHCEYIIDFPFKAPIDVKKGSLNGRHKHCSIGWSYRPAWQLTVSWRGWKGLQTQLWSSIYSMNGPVTDQQWKKNPLNIKQNPHPQPPQTKNGTKGWFSFIYTTLGLGD